MRTLVCSRCQRCRNLCEYKKYLRDPAVCAKCEIQLGRLGYNYGQLDAPVKARKRTAKPVPTTERRPLEGAATAGLLADPEWLAHQRAIGLSDRMIAARAKLHERYPELRKKALATPYPV